MKLDVGARRMSSRVTGMLLAAALACAGDPPVGPGNSAGPLAPGSIAGRVRDAGGAALAGVRVTAGTPSPVASAVTDREGRFTLGDLQPGAYVVAAVADGYGPVSSSVVVTAGSASAVDLALASLTDEPGPQAGSVAGRVLRADGALVGGGIEVRVRAAAEGCDAEAGIATGATDALGRWGARGLPPGDYVACARASVGGRSFSGSSAFTLGAGSSVEADVLLRQQVSAPSALEGGGAGVVALGDVFPYTFTIVSDGEGGSHEVIVTDTLPLLDDPAGPPGPRDRDGNQAFRYVTDKPTFDPVAIRYYVDERDDEGGTATDLCFQGPGPSLPAPFVRPASTALCGAFREFATIAEARTAAETASRDGDQIVAVEYYIEEILARTPTGGDVEAEDSFEVIVEAIHSVNEFRLDNGAVPAIADENGCWCNLVTAISAENDFVAKGDCTRVVEAVLEVRKTLADAVVPAGSQAEFLVELGNVGSAPLGEVTVNDTLDPSFSSPLTGDPGLVMEEGLCAGCTIGFSTDSSVVTITIPSVPSTDADGDGILDDDEGFRVANLVTRTPLRAGTFCNRVTARDEAGRTDSDLACAVTRSEVELDVVNEDGLLGAGGFEDMETFRVGDSVAYRTLITNRSSVAATGLTVLWEIAPGSRILGFATKLLADPAGIACSTASDTCSLELPELGPGASVALDYLTVANGVGSDVNRIRLLAAELGLPLVNEEPTTVTP
ncbi:MAG: carboxypeptidase regulatory-like domain-containing protein [Gemmatimonadetes bacterium]|nr:carboxypeptidase regulatory-like domain-containing protein [Gemmatimonadota bacterium]